MWTPEYYQEKFLGTEQEYPWTSLVWSPNNSPPPRRGLGKEWLRGKEDIHDERKGGVIVIPQQSS